MSAELRVEGLVAGYGARVVVPAVSFRVGSGELWAVLGPNGAGKSTLLRTCLGLQPALGGAATVNGREVHAWQRAAFARQVAYLPQAPELEEGFTGLDVVLMGRAPHQRGLHWASETDRSLARDAMAELGVAALAPRRAETLSGGERRLLLLARALVQGAGLLLMDEPTAFLDLRHQVEVLTRVQARTRAGLGALAVLHDVNLAAAFATHVLLLGHEGVLLAQGPAAELLTAEKLEALYGLPMVASESGGQRVFAPRFAR